MTYEHPEPDQAVHLDLHQYRSPLRSRASQDFEALSYAWGDATTSCVAFVSDNAVRTNRCGYLPLAKNLETALRYLRLPKEICRLWIDAVCINQQDLQERAAQVVRLRTIYHMASRVLVWLGPGSHDSGVALQTLAYLGKQIEVSNAQWIFRASNATEPDWWNLHHPLPWTMDQWASIERLFARPWFRRLWVVQEIAVANEEAVFLCGDESLSWHVLRRAILALDTRAGVPATLSYALKTKSSWDIVWMARLLRTSLSLPVNTFALIRVTSYMVS